jgi:hypothetical protein
MNTVNDTLLITAAPTEMLVGLAIFFTIAALLLVALSMEQGNYPQLKCSIQRLGWGFARAGRQLRRWLFVPTAYHTVPEGT